RSRTERACPSRVEKRPEGSLPPSKQAPRRPGTAPAPGLRAEGAVIIPSQTGGDFIMRLRKKTCAPRLEQLEDRCLLSANVVIEWNQLAVHAVGQARLNPVAVSRALAITQVAVYDAVNAIDRAFEPYHANVQAPSGASPEAAAAQAAHDALTAL